MPIVHAPWWCIEIPDEWLAEDDDEAVIIADPDDVGELCISAIKKQQGSIDTDELKEFAADLIEQNIACSPIEVAGLQGLYFAYETNDEDNDKANDEAGDEEGESAGDVAWREWYLTDGQTMVYASYNTERENAEIDALVIDQILSTLVLVDNSEAAEGLVE